MSSGMGINVFCLRIILCVSGSFVPNKKIYNIPSLKEVWVIPSFLLYSLILFSRESEYHIMETIVFCMTSSR